jgi:hypothetical protein
MSAGKGSQARAVNGDSFRCNYEAVFGRNHFAAVTEGVAGDSRRERPEPSHLFNMTEFQTALFWCASWLDTLSDHLHGKGLAWEMLGELSRKRRENPALHEAFNRVGWTYEAEANFQKARLVPEGEV